MRDLIIRNARLVDGTGAPARPGIDVAVADGVIVEVGPKITGRAHREIDAEGHLVTPGFVDNHTHYDGQATWDTQLAPSSWHGVTTLVLGNCGVGVAPTRVDRREWMIQLMEGVEDIPGAVLTDGMEWAWESFPEYLDALASKRRVLDVAAQVPHAPVRAYVMGERGANNEDPTEDDLEAMSRIVAQGMEAGAIGFSTSRTMLHRMPTGEVVAGSFAGADELLALGRAMASRGTGVFQLASDFGVGGDIEGRFGRDLDWMIDLAHDTRRPVAFALLQSDRDPEHWRDVLDRTEAAARSGAELVALTPVRSVGILLGLQTSLHPFKMHPTYQALEHLPLAERVRQLRSEDTKAKVLSETTRFTGRFNHDIAHGFWKMYPLGVQPDYEPAPEQSIQARAEREGRDPYELCYELLLDQGGEALIFFPLSDYAYGNLDATFERLQRPGTLPSLSDGGAHCGLICDAFEPDVHAELLVP